MSGPWEDYQKKETPEEKGPWNDYKTPVAEDNSKYQNAGVSTFLANAVNSATFGLPDYLNKTFSPETYAETQKYVNANPMAATAGDIAGYAIPTGAGAVKGAQLGGRVATGLAERFAPNIPALAKFYGQSQGGITGATMGAQAVSALPGVIQGNPGQAVAAPEVVNQYANMAPMINHLGGLTGHVVPAMAGVAATATQSMQDRIRDMMKYVAAKRVLGQQQ